MEPLTLAKAALAALGPYLTAAGTAAAQKAGEAIYRALEKRFGKRQDVDGQRVLDNARHDPEVYNTALLKFLERQAEADEEFRQWLTEQLQTTAPEAVKQNIVDIDGNENVVAIDGSMAVGRDLSGEVNLSNL
jgi:hypothetical protein